MSYTITHEGSYISVQGTVNEQINLLTLTNLAQAYLKSLNDARIPGLDPLRKLRKITQPIPFGAVFVIQNAEELDGQDVGVSGD